MKEMLASYTYSKQCEINKKWHKTNNKAKQKMMIIMYTKYNI